jgi:3-deoxy-7-phosphoheptulonate synthase
MQKITNLRVQSFTKLISPHEIALEIPIHDKTEKTIAQGKNDFINILNGKDKRFVVVTGPCSIHDLKSAIEYAEKIKGAINKYGDKLFIIMRVYFEKPRTATGWKGLINDPYLDKTYNVETGIKIARKLLIDINELGVPVGTEFLDPITAAYIGALVSWGAIGARTIESQTHRQMTSGLSAPVGFKNNSNGNLDVAINAMQIAKSSHSFLGIDNNGNCSIVKTNGNSDTHIILRGGGGKPNYYMEDIKKCEKKLEAKGFTPKIMVDCSHENSGKDPAKQSIVIKDIIAQKENGNKSIFGIMLESNLFDGNQKITDKLKYGVSITDACIGWEETEQLLHNLYENLKT